MNKNALEWEWAGVALWVRWEMMTNLWAIPENSSKFNCLGWIFQRWKNHSTVQSTEIRRKLRLIMSAAMSCCQWQIWQIFDVKFEFNYGQTIWRAYNSNTFKRMPIMGGFSQKRFICRPPVYNELKDYQESDEAKSFNTNI